MTQLSQTNPYINMNDPVALYTVAQQHMKSGNWEAGLAAVDKLLKNFPDVQDLRNMREKFEIMAQQDATVYKRDEKYLELMRSVKKGNWALSLSLLDQLVTRYPQAGELQTLRNKLLRRARQAKERRLRRALIALLLFLAVFFVAVSVLFIRYLDNPRPLTAMIAPQLGLTYPPHYLFSIYNIDKPVGIAISPQGDRIYVSEMGGSRQVKVFNRDGVSLGALEPPHINSTERAPVYITVDSTGRVYITDREQHAVFVFSRDGDYLDTLLSPDMTLSEYMSTQPDSLGSGEKYVYNLFQNTVYYRTPDGSEQSGHLAYYPEWAPLGIRFNAGGDLFLTDVTKDNNLVYRIKLEQQMNSAADPSFHSFGATGQENGQLLFPNSVAVDSQGRIFVSDGNNRRISVWDSQGKFLFNFGNGVGESALSLPRGIIIDKEDHLYVVDAVGQNVKVYDVSQAEPVYLFSFGDFGIDDGLFNYPNDITIDDAGRLFIVDRENNRVQVWTY